MSKININNPTIISNFPSLNQPEKQQKQIPTEFICYLCKRLFEQPLLLSCGHSFCRKCLQPWLRKSTNCPFCRSNTLTPLLNKCLEEKISNFKKQNGNLILNENNEKGFIRSFVRRSVRPAKEPQTLLQREALRASQRRPSKGIVLPIKNENKNNYVEVNKENLKKETKNEDKKEKPLHFPRMGNLRQSFARMRGKKNFTDQKTNDCRSISNSLSQDEILSNQECGYTNVRFTKIQRSIPPTKIERMSTSSSSGFSPISSHSNISTNKNNLNYSRLRAPSLGVSGSIIARRNSSNKSETLNNGKKNLGENSSVDTKGCLLM